jgi:geranylgeranyl reductase family protein
MRPFSEVAVVGGGPCGSFTALNLAMRGIGATVFEEHDEVGFPLHCPGHVSVNGLKRLGLCPLPAGIVENTFSGAVFYSSKGRSFPVRFARPVTCTVNRILFDKYIARMAENAGVHFRLSSRIESLIIENGFVKGVKVRRKDGTEDKSSAKIVVDAEGVSSRILRLAGLTALNRRMVVNGVQAEVDGVKDIEPNTVEVFLGKDYASGFYAWLIPKHNGKAEVGLAARNESPKDLLRKLMSKHPAASKKLQSAKILRMSFHPLTLGGLIEKSYSDGFLAVGDAASQVKPTTGGGVILGMTCARIAAETCYEALSKNDCSSAFLSKYQKRCKKALGFDMSVMLRIRKMLDVMSDDDIDDVLCLFERLELGGAVEGFGDMDFQGQSLLRLLQKPKIMVALSHFIFHYLSAIM